MDAEPVRLGIKILGYLIGWIHIKYIYKNNLKCLHFVVDKCTNMRYYKIPPQKSRNASVKEIKKIFKKLLTMQNTHVIMNELRLERARQQRKVP